MLTRESEIKVHMACILTVLSKLKDFSRSHALTKRFRDIIYYVISENLIMSRDPEVERCYRPLIRSGMWPIE